MLGAGLRRTRALVTVFFFLDGFLFGNWVVCVPQIKAHVHASSGGLGVALLGISAGAVVTMVASGRLCARFGSAPMTLFAAALMSLAIMLPARVTSVALLAAALFVFGAGFGALNVAVNSTAVEITGRVGRPIMPSFHAAFSLGGLGGALVGGALASVLSPAWHLTLVGALGLVVTAVAGSLLLRSAPSASGEPAARAEQPGSAGRGDLAAP